MHIKNILTKVKKHDFRGYNYLEDANISDYFKADEYFSYYKSQIHVAPRRDISEQILSHNIPFLFSLIDEDICKKIDNVIKDSIFNQTVDIKTNINNSAKAINHQGYKLLKIKDNLTPDYLKSCYRNAARKHHPDLGGKKKDMQIINEENGQFPQFIEDISVWCRRG
ncbi:MAG: J domain-containing protein [Candidatus Scalindua rubra]|uniref:DnaJ domain protein n=1 Tax=Candidatus Scalindua brodae TaxID=237368 RepID=A0A0B0EKG0_9BACT|nr:MAG: DnaJ domain protein [Candidatus Scalindua brodae]MBZ0108358.1 J domain-containing protein [Candidatus Scalindua rubra]TWU34056.1 DnaJ domain protein [Candidatus Brocadiaceae bacterium S225]